MGDSEILSQFSHYIAVPNWYPTATANECECECAIRRALGHSDHIKRYRKCALSRAFLQRNIFNLLTTTTATAAERFYCDNDKRQKQKTVRRHRREHIINLN